MEAKVRESSPSEQTCVFSYSGFYGRLTHSLLHPPVACRQMQETVSEMLMLRIRQTSLAVGILMVAIQFVPKATRREPDSSHGVHMSDVDPRVSAILVRSCQDCHSASTHWPWYSRIAPVSWIVERDVRLGRAKLDLSDWDARHHSRNELKEICDAVSNGSMPIRVYTLSHRRARLSSQDVDRICDWSDSADAPQSSFSASAKDTSGGRSTNNDQTQKGAQ